MTDKKQDFDFDKFETDFNKKIFENSNPKKMVSVEKQENQMTEKTQIELLADYIMTTKRGSRNDNGSQCNEADHLGDRIADLENQLRELAQWAVNIHEECVTCVHIDNEPSKNFCYNCATTLKDYKRHPALKIADKWG